jgi:hypothetical protein
MSMTPTSLNIKEMKTIYRPPTQWSWETLIPLCHQKIGHPSQRIDEMILELNDTIDRIFYPETAQYTIFALAHGTSLK